MKTRLRPYTQFLLKQNLTYIIMAVVLIFATAGMLYYLNDQVAILNGRIKTARIDIENLSSRRATLKSVNGESSDNLDQDLEIMTALIPDSEDYFSIINALETLSNQSGFKIDSYTINLLASTSNRLSLTVIGNGNSDAFLAFLKNYQLGGGRLITAENIGLDPQQTGSIRLDLNFYNKKVSTTVASDSAAAPASLGELNTIKSKISFSLSQPARGDQPLQDYPTKTDPF
ncbi:hypothetical protein HYS00_04470 [Candidatus Microgenomates bacterium]|nr:hypothetical protein [Candidatus Microgenomates bacterium]